MEQLTHRGNFRIVVAKHARENLKSSRKNETNRKFCSFDSGCAQERSKSNRMVPLLDLLQKKKTVFGDSGPFRKGSNANEAPTISSKPLYDFEVRRRWRRFLFLLAPKGRFGLIACRVLLNIFFTKHGLFQRDLAWLIDSLKNFFGNKASLLNARFWPRKSGLFACIFAFLASQFGQSFFPSHWVPFCTLLQRVFGAHAKFGPLCRDPNHQNQVSQQFQLLKSLLEGQKEAQNKSAAAGLTPGVSEECSLRILQLEKKIVELLAENRTSSDAKISMSVKVRELTSELNDCRLIADSLSKENSKLALSVIVLEGKLREYDNFYLATKLKPSKTKGKTALQAEELAIAPPIDPSVHGFAVIPVYTLSFSSASCRPSQVIERLHAQKSDCFSQNPISSNVLNQSQNPGAFALATNQVHPDMLIDSPHRSYFVRNAILDEKGFFMNKKMDFKPVLNSSYATNPYQTNFLEVPMGLNIAKTRRVSVLKKVGPVGDKKDLSLIDVWNRADLSPSQLKIAIFLFENLGKQPLIGDF